MKKGKSRSSMKAMILAAGFGTRLRPLTDERPKALMPVANVPALGRNIDYLKGHGVTRIVVNAHHHHDQVVEYLDQGRPFGLEIEVRVEEEILGTGGGIQNTIDCWDTEPFFVLNSDILTDIDLGRAYAFHRDSGAVATMVLHDCRPFNQVAMDEKGNITDIANAPHSGRLAFTGIHIISPELLQRIPKGFSDIISCYRKTMNTGKEIKGYLSRGHFWRDIGTLESYIAANRELSSGPFAIDAGCRIDPSARLEEWGVVGRGARIEEGVEVRRSILWEGVSAGRDVKIIDSIVTSGREVKRDLFSEIY